MDIAKFIKRLRRLFATTICIVVGSATLAAAEPDWTNYERLLQQYITPGTTAGIVLNQVDYDGLSRDPLFAAVVAQLAAFPLERIAGREETIAFYINAYNILALKLVIDHWPIDSIKEVGNLFRSVWKRPAGILGGTLVSLDEIEHNRLRKAKEPRIHLAIVCASVSCPDLRTEAYRSERLDGQLDAQCTDFLNNPGKGLRLSGKYVEVSKIFDWFGKDFDAEGGITAFVRRYYRVPDGMSVRPSMDYNWSLNGR